MCLVLLQAAILLGGPATAGQSVSVFAAASLKDAFTTIARQYESSHPGVRVDLNFAGSQTLAAQINHGASADVFASASMKNLMDALPNEASVRVFAHNRLTIVVRSGFNRMKSAKDLSAVPKLVLADASVPAGKYAQAYLEDASKNYGKPWFDAVQAHVVSRELDVRAVLAKVRLGEADAGIVYVSDAVSARGQMREIPIPPSLNPIAKYPVGLTAKPANRDGGKDFIKFLFAKDSQRTLESNGFISPIRAVSSLQVISGGSVRTIKLPLPLRRTSIQVVGHDGKHQKVFGVPFSAILPKLKGSVTFVGADEYSKTFKAAELAKAMLVREADGNYQIVVAGFTPDWWVKWIRRIELRP